MQACVSSIRFEQRRGGLTAPPYFLYNFAHEDWDR
jgi:hypothetical protein